MKTLIALLILASGTWVPAADVVQVPTRIGEIEQTFKMEFIKTVEKRDERFWLFVIQILEPFQASFPVVVPEAATDKEVKIAINAAASCAGFYEAKAKTNERRKGHSKGN